jgi:DNA-directed RNA polymerase subunit alpha
MLQEIYLPGEVDIKEDAANTATFTIKPYHPGYGPTVGNALRRVLLSSLPGAAITQMKIEKIDHEFSALPGVQEDIVSIMLNIKGIRVSSTSNDPIEIKLTKKGAGEVTAGDFSTPPEVKIINSDHVIGHITDKDGALEMTCTVERGRGYVPSETQDPKLRTIGTIALDATFTPVERVSFSVENVRVGQATDYHSLIMQIATNGSITPQEALQQASSILRDHFTQLAGDFSELLTANRPVAVIEEEVVEVPLMPENTLNLLQLPSRVHNALERVGITTVEQVIDLTDEQISDIPGLGAKAVQDVADARDGFAKKTKEEQNTTSHEKEDQQ